jgi:hypothetical protein
MPTVYIPDAHITLVSETCYLCGLVFAMPDRFMKERREDQHSFYCPNGHSQAYVKSAADTLRDELAKQKHLTEQAQARAAQERDMRLEANRTTERVERRLRATRAVVTRTKKKIVAGRCPCCSHQFKNLRDHMAKEHPKYDPDKAAAAIESKVTP